MKGEVNRKREAVVRIRIGGTSGRFTTVDAVIDTGYSGALTLRPSTIHELQLPYYNTLRAELGDGKLASFDVHIGILKWDGGDHVVEVYEAETEPLIGMGLLEGHQLSIHVKNGGLVSIRRRR